MFRLIVFAILTRVPFLFGGVIPFSFDHGKDSMAVLHMIKTSSLKFIGPWTSIPGLFFGPGWYYLLSPAYFISNGHPVSAVLLMFVIGLLIIWLTKKYFGNYAAIIMASAPAFILLSTGAVNTFPIPLISLLILIILGQAAKQKEIKTRQAFLIGLIAGLGFHFSSALAIFYLLLMPLSFLILKIKLTVKKILIGAGGLMLSFLPQVLFEIKNNFLQTKGVINYFLTGESQKISLGKIKLVTNSIIHELSLAVLPDILWFKIICLIILLIGLINLIQIRKIESFTKLLVFWLVVPTIGFWWLHFNPWYVYGLLPVVVLLASKILSSLPNRIANVYFSLLVLAVFIKLFNFWQVDRENLLKNKALLPMKLKAINYIYEKAEGAPFSSYHYLPEIYDYAYQYLFFWQGFKGRQIPVEFSYQPGEISYVNEKPDLLEKVDKTEFKAEKIFFIIEKPENKWHYPLDEWLRRIEYSEIVMKESIGPELEVWEALP